MITDILFVLVSLFCVVNGLYEGTYMSAIVWVGIGAYALGNFIERKLVGSKFDY